MQVARQQQLAGPLRGRQQAGLQQPAGTIDAIPAALSTEALGHLLLGVSNGAITLERSTNFRELGQVVRPGQCNG